MTCNNYSYNGLGACKNSPKMNPIKGIEIIFISNKEVEMIAISHDKSRNPATNESISFFIDGEDYLFYRTDNGTYKTTKELF